MTIKELIEIALLITTTIIIVKSFFDNKRGSNVDLCNEIEKTNCNHSELEKRVIVIETQFKNHVKELKELKMLTTENHKEVISKVESIYNHVNTNTNKVNELLALITGVNQK